MKRKEWIITAVVAAIAVIALLVLKFRDTSSGYVVAIQHRNTIVMEFDPMVDAVYTVDGDTGGLQVEVKDGRWHVINEQCPNHVCANMGWMGVNDIGIPITCLPNNIIIFLEETPK
ncbi:MAG: NusG domain II-containing protein [Solobacterium sp.]|nr:NusG domain II-containing protein [Solobacterium sp.]